MSRGSKLTNEERIVAVQEYQEEKYIPSTPQITAENVLKRDFHADKPNEK